jgi:hypothetical protein
MYIAFFMKFFSVIILILLVLTNSNIIISVRGMKLYMGGEPVDMLLATESNFGSRYRKVVSFTSCCIVPKK